MGISDPRSQTLPTAVGIRHEKFRPFRSEEHPGGHFFKAERVLLSILVKRLSKQIASGD